MSINDELNAVLEDTLAYDTPVPENPWARMQSLSQEIEEKQRDLQTLETRRAEAMNEFLEQLAIGLRQSHPNLNVILRSNGCSVGFRTKSLYFSPDFVGRSWAVSGPDQAMANKFSTMHANAMPLTRNMAPLTNAIINFFRTHYRSLK